MKTYIYIVYSLTDVYDSHKEEVNEQDVEKFEASFASNENYSCRRWAVKPV